MNTKGGDFCIKILCGKHPSPGLQSLLPDLGGKNTAS